MELLKKQFRQRRDTFIATNPRNYAKEQQDHSIEVYADTTTVLVIQRHKTGVVWHEHWLERKGASVRLESHREPIPLNLNHYPPKAKMVYGTYQTSTMMPSNIVYDREDPTLLMYADFYHLKKIVHVISETGVVMKTGVNQFSIDFPK